MLHSPPCRDAATFALLIATLSAAGFVTVRAAQPPSSQAGPLRFEVTYPASRSEEPLDGRLLLMLSTRKRRRAALPRVGGA